MFLRNAHALMPQQNRNTFQGYTGEQEFNSERIAEPVRVGVRNTGQLKQTAQAALPVTYTGLGFALARPEEILRARRQWDCVQRIGHSLGQWTPNRRSRFCRVQEQLALLNAVATQSDRIPDSQATVAQQENQGTQAHGVGPVGVIETCA